MKPTRQNLLPLTSLALTAAMLTSSLTGCALLGGPPPQQHGPMPVELMTLKGTSVAVTSSYLVTLEARENVTLQPETSGRVVAIMTAPGQVVQQGQPLIQLDAGAEYAAIQASQSSVQAAQADLKKAEDILRASKALRESSLSNIDYNEKQLTRTKALLEQDAASPQELEKATDSMKKARNDLAINDAQIASQEKAIASAKANINRAMADSQRTQALGSKLTIRAPFSGVVGNIPVRVGQSVSPGHDLLQVTDARRLELNLAVAVDEAKKLKLGQKVQLQNNQGQVVGEAHVFFIATDVDPSTQTTLVKAFIDNSNGLFRAEEQLKAAIVWQEIKGIVIPPSAISHLAGQDFVFVATELEAENKDDAKKDKSLVAKQRPVMLGDMLQSGYRVIKGLEIGDVIVSAGIQKLQDNMPIQVLKAPPADAGQAVPKTGKH